MIRIYKRKRKKNTTRDIDQLDWIDFDEDDEVDEDYEDEEMDEDDEDYEDEEMDEDDEDYEDEEIDEEDYYEDDEIDEEDEEYYEDDEIDEEDEAYYEDDEIDEDDEEYYEDDEIDGEDEDYEDDEYYEDKPGGFGKIAAFFMNMSMVDYVVAFTGIIVLVLAGVVGVMFVGNKMNAEQLEAFAEVGVGVESMPVIGESGLLAIADAQAAKLVAAELQQIEEEATQVDDETGKIAVEMNLTSIQKDLKIKFINKKSGKLIPNISFEVEVTDPSGNTVTWKDDDKDGIIYKTGITPGKYKVAIKNSDELPEYSFSKEPVAITVRDTIEYQKVDVAAEVKTEAQVNAAVEDTKINETVVESVNADTVEWVESTKTLIEGTEETQDIYEEVNKDRITDPSTKTAAGFKLLAGVTERETQIPLALDSPTEPTAEPTEAPTEPTAEPIETPTAEPTKAPEATPAVTPSVSPSVTPSASPSATPSASPTATPNNAKNDTTTNLKDNDGNQLYVKDGDHYREAKYADYFNSNLKFYKKTTKTTGKYRYTGWQTIDGSVYFFDKNGNMVTGEQVIQGAKYTFNENGVLNTGSGNMGIDVSKWNGGIDWNAVRNSGVSYVIIRCGYRGSTTGALIEDPMFRSNIKGAQNAGLKVGIYFFTQAVNEVEAVEEASMVLGLIQGYNITYPVFLDVESSGGRADGISVDTRTAVCKAFCQTIQNSGYKAGIYANKTWFTTHIKTASLTNYKIWLAQYAAAPTYTATKYDMWQYSSKGRVSGISGNVDMNISYMGY